MLSLPADASLRPSERFGLNLLLDLSAVLRCDDSLDAAVPLVRLEVRNGGASPTYAALSTRNWGIASEDGVVIVDRALLTWTVEVAGAVTEQRSAAADRHGRVPAAATPPVIEQFERRPAVSHAARSLAQAVAQAAGRRPVRFIEPWPDGRRWAAALSHDLDVVSWWPAFTLLRLTELARRGDLTRTLQVIASATRSATRDVVWNAVREVLDAEARHDVRSSWFVLCGTPSFRTARAGDLTYRPESPMARRIFDAVSEAGHELGLHGSFATSSDHTQFGAQRSRLGALTQRAPVGVRQHYLRLRAATTPRGMAQAGFEYDSSYGYADRNGFRLGVADVVPLWNDAESREVGIDEAPFVWMDRALSKYQGVEQPRLWIDDAIALADECRAVEGMWVGIWHPNLAPALGFPGAPAAYARLVAELAAREPFVAPLGELVRWRRARRALRAFAIAPDGRVRLSAAGDDAGHAFSLRDLDGRVMSGAGS